MNLIRNIWLEIYTFKITTYLPGANELNPDISNGQFLPKNENLTHNWLDYHWISMEI